MRRRLAVIGFVIAALAAGSLAFRASPVQAGFGYHSLNKIQKRLVSGALLNMLGPGSGTQNAGIHNDDGPGADGAPNVPPSSYGTTAGGSGLPANYFPTSASGCAAKRGATNVKVNQNCLNVSDPTLQGRGQANNESSIAQNPFNTQQIVASNNDYVRGDGTCGTAYSTNDGKTWTNSTVPDSFTLGATAPREYWQAGGDTSVAWDTRGNAYLACQLFNRGTVASTNPDQSSTFVVFRSTGNGGASFNFPGRYVVANFDAAGTSGILEDKELIAVDSHTASPYRDRVYVTWTTFAADGTAYIYEAYSSNYGESFSSPVLVSGNNTTFCTNTYGLATPHGNCNENQFSQPFVGSDGTLYVTFNNFNNTVSGNDNRNQILLARSTDGGQSFSRPVKVSDYYDLPDCDTYQGAGADSFRACVPEKGRSTVSVFRATNYSSGVASATNSKFLIVTFGSYINKDSNESNGCVPAGLAADGQDLYTGVKTAGACNNKILYSVSTDGGKTFSGASVDPRNGSLVTNAPGQVGTDQFWQWTAITNSGTVAVDYYDRQYGRDEFNGSSDFSLSTSRNGINILTQRVTTSSMPAPTQFYGPKGGQFYGDYTGLTAVNDIHPVWSDTRNADLFLCPGSATGPGNPPALCTATELNGLQANDEEMFTSTITLSPA